MSAPGSTAISLATIKAGQDRWRAGGDRQGRPDPVKKGYGYADVATKTAMDPDRTTVRIGSTSKLFTWTAVMQFVEQGKIDLNADVNRYLDFTIPARAGRARSP
jgi:CubicO group peptidase (beta-lactamase class C family)